MKQTARLILLASLFIILALFVFLSTTVERNGQEKNANNKTVWGWWYFINWNLADFVASPFRPLFLLISGLWLWSGNLAVLLHWQHSRNSRSTGANNDLIVTDHHDLLQPILVDSGEESLQTPLDSTDSLASLGDLSSGTGFTAKTANFAPSALQLYYSQTIHHLFRLALTLTAFLGAFHCYWRYQNIKRTEWASPTSALICLLLLLALTLSPFNAFYLEERQKFSRALYRIIFGGIWNTKVLFTDVLLADILTSYSRVFSDIWALFCGQDWMGQMAAGKTAISVRKQCAISGWSSVVISLPYLWRLRQCLAEYLHNRTVNHLQFYNAWKYASMFPVILSNYGLANFAPDSALLYYSCIGFATGNSLFSLYWDLVHDWGLFRNRFGLREVLIFQIPSVRFPWINHGHHEKSDDADFPLELPISTLTGSPPSGTRIDSPRIKTIKISRAGHRQNANCSSSVAVYYLAILFNTVTRFAWAIRLYLLGNGFLKDFEYSIFLLECTELLRRWVWIFLRVERQWITTRFQPRQHEND